MKTISRLALVLGLSILGLSSRALAVCNSGANCENPTGNGTAGSWTASASGMSGIQSLDSVGPSGNDVGSRYYFAAATTNLGATVAKGGISTTGDGSQVIGSFALNSGGTPGSTVFGGVVQQLLGNQGYFFYAQACPSGTVLDSARCSVWAQIGSKSTLPYPSSVFVTPVRPTDTSVNTIAARTNVPNADLGNISQVQFEVDNLITGGLNQTGILIGWPGVNQSNVIDSSMYTVGGGFKPNVKYQYKGQVYYPYGVAVPTGGSQTETNLWTTPVNPGAVSVSNITHCSAQITALNSSGNPANPAYTFYSLCATGTSGSCANDQISGGTSGDNATALITDLNPGTLYTPNATALVGNNDGTSAGWNNSGTTNGSNFTTLAWGGTFNIGNVTTTSADATVSGVATAGITAWQIKLNGNVAASGTAVDLNGVHTLSGLTPNTAYTATILLTEGSGCTSTLNFNPNAFTTTPVAPASATFANVLATSLQITWTDPSANPNGSTYEIQLCTGAGFTGCQTNTVNKPGTSTSFTVSPTTTYFGRVRTQNQSRPTWPDSSWTNTVPASVTTPTNQSAISVSPNPGNTQTGVALPFSATVTDQTGAVIVGQPVTWSYGTSNGDTSLNTQISQTLSASTTLNATSAGNFVLTAHLGGVYADVFVPVHVDNAGPVVSLATVVMNPDNITANLSCTASDPGFAEPTLTYTWSLISPTGAPLSYSINGTNAAKNSVVTLTQSGTYIFRCTATDPASVSGPKDTAPTLRSQVLSALSVSPNNVTINIFNHQAFTAVGTDQFGAAMAPGSVSWSAANGSVNGLGLFQPSILGTNIRVTATNGTISGSAFVTVVNYDVSSAFAFPVPYKSTMGVPMCFKNLGTDAKLRIFTTSGRLVYHTEVINADNSASCPFPWNVKNNAGENLASGVYLYVIESPTTTKHGKLIIIQ